MKIKICGITSLDDAILCESEGAAMIGFIFYEKSKRFVTIETAGAIAKHLSGSLLKVGVFVDEQHETVNDISSRVGLDLVQLHGNETPGYVDKIKLPVIKAFRIDNNFSWSVLDQYNNCQLLLDSYSANEMGGTGKSFDWKNIPDQYKNKIILSGGISIHNIETLIREINPAAIDLSSSLELSPGKKDHMKVKEFFKKYNELRSK